MTFNGRQPLMEDKVQWKTSFNGSQPSMEDHLRWETKFNGRYDLENRGNPGGNLECGSAQPSLFLNII